jgi:hypothetical protein
MSETEIAEEMERLPEDGEPEPDGEPGEQEPDGEPGEPIEPDDGDGDGEQFGDETDSEARRILTEKALRKRDDLLDKENARHAKRVGEIMEDGAGDLIPCPVCMDGISGWIYAPEAQQLSDEAVLRLRQLIGLSGLEGVPQAAFATRCPDCDGLGEVKTGSRVVGYETTTCERCLKSGWIRIGGSAANGHGELEAEPVVTGPTVFYAEPEDPEVRHLRERGFTVIPPLAVQGG